MQDSWHSVDPYEYFMGRWSRLVAQSFLDWLSPAHGLRWLDVGCGSGALSAAISSRCSVAELSAIDQSFEFVQGVRQRLGDGVYCIVGDATALPIRDSSADQTVSGLVLNFIPEPTKALAEMKRVTATSGVVAAYVWDYTRKMDFLNKFWDTVVKLDPSASALHERYRFPDSTAQAMTAQFEEAGFVNIETSPLDVVTRFRDFDDYWRPFLGGQGPAPTYVMSLEEPERQKLREAIFEILAFQGDGSIVMDARAWAVKGTCP